MVETHKVTASSSMGVFTAAAAAAAAAAEPSTRLQRLRRQSILRIGIMAIVVAIPVSMIPYTWILRNNMIMEPYRKNNTSSSTRDKNKTLCLVEHNNKKGTFYEERFQESSTPKDEKSVGFLQTKFYSGFRNQGMYFGGFVMWAYDNNKSQILLPTLRWKDLHGTDALIAHEFLYDVVHWNSFHPQLPRLVHYDANLFPDFDVNHTRWAIPDPERNAIRPMAYGKVQPMFIYYRRASRLTYENPSIFPRHPADVLMMQGAFRPHPDLQRIIHHHVCIETGRGGEKQPYMALHARVEPDMQKHPMCRDKKVIELQPIFDMLQAYFPDPPVETLFIAINRNMLEREVDRYVQEQLILETDSSGKNNDDRSSIRTDDPDGEVAVRNLGALNAARRHGLWDGRVRIFEAGVPILNGTRFHERCPSISGSIVDYFLSLDASLFVGTPVSSFSTDIQSTRFYRGNRHNYIYTPKGLEWITHENVTAPPPFMC